MTQLIWKVVASINDIPVATATTIEEGGPVFINASGYATSSAGAATPFGGWNYGARIVNTGSNGDLNVKTARGTARVSGSFTIADVGKQMYPTTGGVTKASGSLKAATMGVLEGDSNQGVPFWFVNSERNRLVPQDE